MMVILVSVKPHLSSKMLKIITQPLVKTNK
jgi:hypothetical protein